MKIIPSARYQADFDEILERIAQNNPMASVRVWDENETQVSRLEEFPLHGRVGRLAGTRELVIARTPYIVVYSSNGVVILLRILHGAQNWPPAGSNPLK